MIELLYFGRGADGVCRLATVGLHRARACDGHLPRGGPPARAPLHRLPQGDRLRRELPQEVEPDAQAPSTTEQPMPMLPARQYAIN
eukprot:scaffold112391_cov40-Prasinocladus_malaysianus.AAC.1